MADPRADGASVAKRSLAGAMRAWLAHHRSSFSSTLNRLLDDKAQTLLTSLVVAVALALPVLLMLSLSNLQQLGQGWDTEPKLTLYLNEKVSQRAADQFIEQLSSDIRIAQLRYIDADEALREFEALSGFGSVLEGLAQNPLPAAIELSPSAAFQSVTAQQALADELAQSVLVAEANVDLAWVQRFLAITALLQQLVLFLALLLALGALLAIGNTVRLIIENRKDEIVIIKLVGGTNGFVRRPLLYTGGLYGFFGGFIALLLVSIVVMSVSVKVEAIAQAYSASFDLQGLSAVQALQLLVVATSLGWLGSALAVSRHLSDIEPS
ncbi:permease-like cell division protein FtsX [Agaribacterium sp. ZY112]|uniref:permease-like cell division protein FtsX n=1 Tax=Agaribacterium sp. ZY112 TaxID=3233574 RepID=UPI0035261D8C